MRIGSEVRRVDGIGGSCADGVEGGEEELKERVGLREGGGRPENDGGGRGSVEGLEAGKVEKRGLRSVWDCRIDEAKELDEVRRKEWRRGNARRGRVVLRVLDVFASLWNRNQDSGSALSLLYLETRAISPPKPS